MAFLLLALGVVGAVWPVLATAGVMVVGFRWLVGVMRRGHDAEFTRRRRGRELAARADQQNQWFLAGDPRGLYGEHT